MTALEALKRLQEGNSRFVAGTQITTNETNRACARNTVNTQEPLAVILGCSDSRVPPEIIFDQSIGDLFVVRVAGNIATPPQVDSIEFGVQHLGAPLVVVLGHTGCGAILATLAELESPEETQSQELRAIIEPIRAAVNSLVVAEGDCTGNDLAKEAVRVNIQASVNTIKESSFALAERAARNDILIVGAEYSLETSNVDFFCGLAESEPTVKGAEV